MNIIKSICTKSDCYQADKKITVKGLMLHSVGCPQPKASAFINNWNKSGANACVHAIVEPGGDVYQLLPWNYKGWHGGGDSNNTHIGVEMTEPNTIKYMSGSAWTETGDGSNTKAHVLATYKYAVEFFASLCKEYSLDPLADGVIISHSEGYKRGIASNHGDVEHLWNAFSLTMAQFRQDIRTAMDSIESEVKEEESTEFYRVRKEFEDTKSQKGAYKVLGNAKKCADLNPGYYVFDNNGSCVYPNLDLKTLKYGKLKSEMNIRDEASTDGRIVAVYTQGVIIEIVKVSANEWYKIKCIESETGYAYVSNTNSAYIAVGRSVYTVQKGDSLWKISQSILGNGVKYAEIKELNGLTSDMVSVGTQLLIP